MLKPISRLTPFLDQQGFVVLDGGLASELEHLGMDLNDPLWSAKALLEQPEAIVQVHQAYLDSGADLIITASYQASYPGFERRGLSKKAIGRVMRQSVLLAQQAIDNFMASQSGQCRIRPLVAASVGPYGAFLANGSEYTGDYGVDRATLEAFHAPRLAQFVRAEPDLLAFETIPSLEEAEVLLRLLERYPEQQAYLSYSCRDGTRLSSGATFRAGVHLAHQHRQIIAVGVNCTAPKWMASLLASAADLSDLPLVVYPNRGETWDADQKCWVPGSAGSAVQNWVADWYLLGARLLGGCCRVRPTDIRAIRTALQAIPL